MNAEEVASKKIVVCGLAESGKTTFLAALWHLVTSRELVTELTFRSLRSGNNSYLNQIAERWRNGVNQERNKLEERFMVSMNLKGASDAAVRFSLPDVSGEAYRVMWEQRECHPEVAKIVSESSAVMLMVHSDNVEAPRWVVDETSLREELNLRPKMSATPVAWEPKVAPTQVKLVDILQLIKRLDPKPKRVAVVLSAWDRVLPEGKKPNAFLKERAPLLYQYLENNVNAGDWRVYGISAFGGDPVQDANQLRERNVQSTRIRVDDEDLQDSHDLTRPLAWLTM